MSAKIHVNDNDVVVRSRDEKEIGIILEMKCIAYCYEWIPYMYGTRYAPDFAIR